MSRGGYQRTNKWLAEQIGVGQATVSKWCTNSAQVRELDVKFCRINVVSTTKDKKYGHAQREAAPGLYVLTHSSTKDKKIILDKINTTLKMGWKVEIVK